MTRAVTVSLAAAALMAATAAQAQGADEEYGFYAGAGVGEYQVEIDDFDDVTTPLGTATGSDSGDDFTWTAGAGVTIFDTFNLRLEYEQFDFENTDDSTALWLTGAFRF